MKTAIYLSELLYRYQCVIVPGFGAFLTEIQSAQLDEKTNTFFPPKKKISFNAHLKNNDGLLANHYATNENISYEKAVKQIEIEVLSWRKNLEENNEFSIKSVGKFQINDEQNLLFYPSEHHNYLTESFGLSTFVSPKIKRETFSETPQIIPLEEINSTTEIKTPLWKKTLKYAAIFVVTAGTAAAIAYPVYMNHLELETQNLQAEVQKKVAHKIQEATFFIDIPLPTVRLSIKNGKLPYHLVANAFRSEENAEKECQNLINKGFKARKLEKNESGLYPVIYGSYSSMQDAEREKNKIKKELDPDVWILIESL